MTPAARLLAVAVVVLGVHASAGAQISPLSANVRTFTPGAAVQMQIRTSSPTGLAVDVLPVSVADVLVIRRRGDVVRLDEIRSKPVRTVRDGIHPELDRGNLHDLRIGTLPRGYYVLAIHGGTGAGAQLIDVTSLGLVATRTPRGTVAFAVDLQTMHARTDVSVERYADATAPLQTQKASADGTASFDEGPPGNVPALFVAHGADGSAAVADGARSYGATVPDTENGVVQLDRPIYRPGHHVEYRAILRDGTAGAYTIPAGTRTVRVRDPEQKIVYTAKREIDAFGTVSGEVPLAGDARLGTYTVMIGDADDPRVVEQFSVEAYVKPEFTVDVASPPSTVGGDALRFTVNARYLFGRPAAGLRLHYAGYYNQAYVWWRRGDPFRFGGAQYEPTPPPVQGTVTADAAGRATIVVRTPAVRIEQRMNFEVDGRDDAGKTVTANTAAQITPASFYLGVESNAYFIASGDDVQLTIRSRTYANGVRPNVPVALTFTPSYYAGGSQYRDEAEAQLRNVVTDAAGTASVRWKPAHEGYTEVRAHAVDERGRDVTTVIAVWVASARYAHAYRFDTVTVVPQKPAYRPGERAAFLVTAPQGDVDALVRVTGGSTETLSVRRLASQASTIEVDAPRDVARFRVSVYVPTRRGFAESNAEVTVDPVPHKLVVAIRPDKPKYAPGERARFAISVRDAGGNPVRAQVGIAVVDDAIFALRAGSPSDAFRTLYGSPGPYRTISASWGALDEPLSNWLYVRDLRMIGTVQSRSAASQFAPGQTADVYNVSTSQRSSARPPSLDALRNDFRDTAFWSPSVVTDAAGHAVASFDWPDSLTSYTASGVGVTQGSDVGSGRGSALVTKDFLVRLSTPRFLRRGDTARFVALAQGTRPAKSALLRFSAPELGVADETTAVRFDANAGASKTWNVRAGGDLGDASLRLAGSSGALNDGLRVTLPVETSGTAQHERAAGSLPDSAVVALRLARGVDAGDLRIDLAPSLVAQLLADVRLLQVYPYYCVEQTMSAALPAIYVERLRKRTNLPAPDGPAPADVAKRAIDRLAQLQHSDGSWGWWEHDGPNPFMTAYALYGLTELARDGHPVPRNVLDRGVANLVKQIAAKGDTSGLWGGAQPGSEANTRAFMLYALADASPSDVDRTILAQTDARSRDLNSYAVAVLGLAHLELGDREGARPLLAELLKRVNDDGTYARWEGPGWHYRWEDDPIETTAYALRFVHAMNAGDPHVARAVLWLRSQQRGSWFATTKDTAAAIYAMSETIAPESNELQPHETVRVVLDGRTIKQVRIEAAVLSRADASILVPARALRRGGTLRFEREGTGALYWSTDWTRYAHGVTTAPVGAPFQIARTMGAPDGNEWHVGDVVDVDLTVTADEDAQFVAIEDPLPAGLAYQPRQHESGDNWSGLQFFDDRVVFFATRLSRFTPLRLHYRLRATTAGTFTAPPPTAYAMYGPPSTAAGRAARITIR
ncbi:MAG: MG2 domain-containing protein [Candidatus Eremiobacteraeota bacterium]|nr:MG2 domain-containing protein [Candidatus Eremiobacteraeota bacterium]